VRRGNQGSAAVVVVVAAALLAACGGSSSAAQAPAKAAAKAPNAAGDAHHCATIAPNPTAAGQPSIPQPGALTGKLVVKDVTVGHGPAAAAGASLSVSYIGVSCSDGKVFDATYRDGGQPFTVAPLGTASVITGWNKGLIGVKAGGVRELVIPPAEGYGKTGNGPIPPNDTIVFLITVKSVSS
jgi:peptidylprolyl isomerase